MEETKTTLQKIVEQKTDQIRIAIERAIDNGAIIVKNSFFCATIDDVFLQKDMNGHFAVVLHFDSEKILNELLKNSKNDLEKLAEQKRRELEDIEKQIKEKEAKDETDRN